MKVGTTARWTVATLAAGIIAGAVLRQVYLATRTARARRLTIGQPAVAATLSGRPQPDADTVATAATLSGRPQPDAGTVATAATLSGRPQPDAGTVAAPATPKDRRRIKTSASPERGSKRTPSGVEGMTKQQLYLEARKRNIRGRSSMTKAQLRRALG